MLVCGGCDMGGGMLICGGCDMGGGMLVCGGPLCWDMGGGWSCMPCMALTGWAQEESREKDKAKVRQKASWGRTQEKRVHKGAKAALRQQPGQLRARTQTHTHKPTGWAGCCGCCMGGGCMSGGCWKALLGAWPSVRQRSKSTTEWVRGQETDRGTRG